MINVTKASGNQLWLEMTKYADVFVDRIREVPIADRSYCPMNHSWMIKADYLPGLVEKIGRYNFSSEDPSIMRIITPPEDEEDRAAKTKERLKNIALIRDMDFKTYPMPHQIEGFNYAIAKPKLLIADMPGLGKSKTAIDAAVWRKSRNLISKCLIVCCVNSTKYNWQKEIQIHSDEKSVIFDQSTAEKKLKAIQEWKYSDELFGIINIESIRPKELDKNKVFRCISGYISPANLPMNPLLEALNQIADMVIVDEIHKCKTPNSKQGIALRQLTPAYRLGLSGTPMTNKADDLWNIMRWLNCYNDGFWTFRKEFCIMGGYEDKEIAGYKDLDRLHKILDSCMLRRKKDEVLDLPPKLFHSEYIELSKKEKKRYREAREGIIKKITDNTGRIEAVTSQNALTTILKLREVTDGLDIDTGLPVEEEDNSKLLRVKEMLNEEIIPNGKKALIFTCWETIADMYRKHLQDLQPAYIVGKVSPADRQKEVERFQNDPNCKVAIGTIGAMGTGLTLTAASYVIFVDKDWNDTENEQAEDRAYRIGTEDSVVIISMIAKNTIDERVEDALAEKRALFSQIVDNTSNVVKKKKTDIGYLLGYNQEE